MAMTRRAKRRMTFVVVVLAILVIGVVLVEVIRANQRARLLIQTRQDGIKAYEDGDYAAAIEHLNIYHYQKQDDPEALMAFGHSRALVPAEGHIQHAILLTRKGLAEMDVLDTNDRDGELYETGQRRLLEWYQKSLQYVEVVEIADRLLAQYPNDIDALSAKSLGLTNQRKLEEVEPVISRLIELDPSNLSWYALKIKVLFSLEVPVETILELTQQWTEEYQDDGRFHVLRAGLLTQINDIEGAREEMRVAEEKGYNDPAVLTRSVAVYDQLGQFNTADSALEKAIELDPTDQKLYEVTVRRFWRANRLEEAKEALAIAENNVEQLSDELVRSKVLLGMFSGNTDLSKSIVEDMLARLEGPEDESQKLWANAMLARILMTDENTQEVLDQINMALSLNMMDASLYYLIGEIQEVRSQNAEALDAYSKARSLEPRWMSANIAYARVLEKLGRPREALPVARVAMLTAPTGMVTPFVLFSRIVIGIEEINKRTASIANPEEVLFVIENLEELYELIPDNEEIPPLLVRGYVLADDLSRARSVIQESIEDRMTSYKELIQLAAISERSNLDLQGQLIQEAARRGTPTQFTVMLTANRLAADQNVDGGLEVIDSAISKLSPSSPDLREWRKLRAVYLMQNGHQRADDALSELVAVYPNDLEIQQLASTSLQFRASPELAQEVVDNLARQLGEKSQIVQLAKANALLSSQPVSEKKLAEATVMIRDVLDKDSDSEMGLVLLVKASLSGEQPAYGAAIDALKELNKFYPDNVDRLVRLIELLQYSGDYEAASMYLAELEQIANKEPRLQRAEISLLRKQGDLASLANRVESMDTPEASIADRILLAQVSQEIGDVERARMIYESMLTGDPTDAELIAVAEFFGSQGEVIKGRDLLSQLVDDESSARVPMIRGIYAAQYIGGTEAEPYFDMALQRSPDEPGLYYEVSRQLLGAGQPDLALKKINRGLESSPNNSQLLESLALTLLESGGDASEALDKLGSSSSRPGALFQALTLIQSIPKQEGKWEPQATHLAQISKLIDESPQYPVLWKMGISMHRDAEKYERAWDLAQQAASRFPTQSEPLRWATSLSMLRGDWEQARADAQAWRMRVPNSTYEPDVLLAQCWMELNEPQRALEVLQPHRKVLVSTVESRPFNTSLLIDALARTDHYDDAETLIKPLLVTDERWPLLWLGISRSLPPEKAAEAIVLVENNSDDSLSTNRAVMRAWFALAARDQADTYKQNALGWAERLAQRPETEIEAKLNLASMTLAEGKPNEAVTIYKEVLQKDPKNAIALNNLAMVLLELNELDEALEAINLAANEYPDVPSFMDSRGQILCAMGRYQESLNELSKVVAMDPSNLGFRLAYVNCLIEAGRFDNAESVLRQGRSTFYDREKLSKSLRTKLESIEERLKSLQVGAE